MKFRDETLWSNIILAINDAERLLNFTSPMMTDIRNKNDWKYKTNKSGMEVAAQIAFHPQTVPVRLYRSANPFSRTLGYSDGKAIYLNSRKKLDHADMVGLLIHEFVHDAGFLHGSNFPSKEKNLYSVPYYCSSNIRKWL